VVGEAKLFGWFGGSSSDSRWRSLVFGPWRLDFGAWCSLNFDDFGNVL
jgi:hypothetical protein